MKITVSKKSISAALQHCCAAAVRNSTMPILKCVQLVPSAEGFTLRAANEGLRMAVSCNVRAQLSQPEALCVSAHDLFDRVKALPDGDIKLVTKSGKLTLEAGQRKLRLSYVSADDYPRIPTHDGAMVRVPSSLLVEAFRASLFAVCEDPSRGELAGLHLKLSGNVLSCLGTDGHRIALFSDPGPDGELNVLIPKPSAIMMRSVLESATGLVGLHREGSTLYADFPEMGASFASVTLNEERFPEQPAVMAHSEPESPCDVMTDSAIDSLKALTAVAGKLGQVTLEKKGDAIIVSAVSENGDESSDQFMAAGGKDFQAFRVQGAYMVDALTATGAETCSIASADDDWRPSQVFGGKFRGVVAKVQKA